MSVSAYCDCYEPETDYQMYWPEPGMGDGYYPEPDYQMYWPEQATGNGYYPEYVSTSLYVVQDAESVGLGVFSGYQPEADQPLYWPEYVKVDAAEKESVPNPAPNRSSFAGIKKLPAIRLLRRVESPAMPIDSTREAVRAAAKTAQHMEDLVNMVADEQSPEIDFAISRILRSAQKLKKRLQTQKAVKEDKRQKSGGIQLRLI